MNEVGRWKARVMGLPHPPALLVSQTNPGEDANAVMLCGDESPEFVLATDYDAKCAELAESKDQLFIARGDHDARCAELDELRADLARLRAALERMQKLHGRPHEDEWVDGGATYKLALELWHEVNALLNHNADQRGDGRNWKCMACLEWFREPPVGKAPEQQSEGREP